MPKSSLLRFTTILILFYAMCTGWIADAQGTDNSFCWKQNFGRGVGTLPSACPNGYSHELAACYTTCKAGYENWSSGAVTCEQQCPSGFTDNPGTCLKPAATSSAGYPWKFGDPFDLTGAMARCNSANPGLGCYISGAIVYPNCAAGFHKFGDLVCTPNCPANMTDSGAFCSKQTYTRSMTVPGCASGTTNDSGLCYSSCGAGFDGVGPVCWSQCPSDHPFQCGAACAVNQSACAAAVGNMVYSTVGVAINAASFVLGGPGITTAGRAALEGAETARTAEVLAQTAETGEASLMSAVKTYGVTFGKTFAKTMLKNQFDNKNLYWSLAKATKVELGAINKAATESGITKDSNSGFDPSVLAAADPTGLASMVMSFAKYGSCTSTQFAVNQSELNFGNIQTPRTLSFTITAQRPTTITRIVSPSMQNSTITPSADCVGKKMNPADTCQVNVTVQGNSNLDSEVRVYSDTYSVVPMAIHVLGSSTQFAADTAVPNVDEAANLTDIQGVWAYAYDQTQKVIVSGNGGVVIQGGGALGNAGMVTPAGDAGRGFAFNTGVYQQTVTLSEDGNHLTSAPLEGYIGFKTSPLVLSLSYYNTADGTPLIAWTNNHVTAQQFSFVANGDGTYRIVSGLSNKVLQVQNSTLADGGAIIEMPWSNMASQRFRVEAIGDGSYYRILNVNSGLALTVQNGYGVKGNPIVQSAWADLGTQHFTLATDYSNFIRRPWDAGCNAGETNYASMCYDVPYGYAMTAPGFMGQVCSTGWRDDGTSCWPAWNGPYITAQADANGSGMMLHPITVTDTRFTSQSCPANFHNAGGFTCTATILSKNVKTISGHGLNSW